MFRLESKIDTSSFEFKENKEHYLQLITNLKEQVQQIRKGGPEHARQLHQSRGKIFVRERLVSRIE